MNDILLEKYIREKIYLVKEETERSQEGSYSYKELYDFFSYIKSGKNAKKALRFCVSILGSSAAENVLELGSNALAKVGEETAGEAISSFLKYLKIPDVKSPIKILAKFYGVNDEKGLKGIAIPDNVSNLIDDKVEEEFISNLLKDLAEKVKSNPNEKVSNTFVLEKLEEFTDIKYSKTKGSYAAIS